MRYASFLVRIWLPDEETGSGEVGLRAIVENLQNRVVVHLSSLEDVLACIHGALVVGDYDQSIPQFTHDDHEGE